MIKRLLYLFLTPLIGGIIALPFLILDSSPLIHDSTNYDAREIDRAKALLKRNDRRKLESGEIVTQWVAEDEIALVSGYLLSQPGGGDRYIELLLDIESRLDRCRLYNI